MPVKKKMHSPVEILGAAYHNALYHFRAYRWDATGRNPPIPEQPTSFFG
jgi:hypothetical protein